MQDNKFGKEGRTFETRLVYIREIFSEKYPQDEILKNCIVHKLNKSYEAYLKDVERSASILTSLERPIDVLKKVN